MTKIVESKVWNRTLVCFRSDPVASRQRGDLLTIYFDASGDTQNRPNKKKSPGTLTALGGFVTSGDMSNVLSDEKTQQIIALGRLGWSLRRIEEATDLK